MCFLKIKENGWVGESIFTTSNYCQSSIKKCISANMLTSIRKISAVDLYKKSTNKYCQKGGC